MWGDFELLQFYPRNWSTGYIRSGHSIIVYITVWQYWMWFTFIFLINAYFLFIFRAFSYRRGDVRGRRSTGDKRRSAWPELFTCAFPLLWCLNILNLSLNILKTIEVNGGFAAVTLQIVGYQWGWRYGYGEMNYIQLMTRPIKVGYNSVIRPGGITPTYSQMVNEVYFCRLRLRQLGALNDYKSDIIEVPTFQSSLWINAQGLSSSSMTTRTYLDKSVEIVKDPLRLLRASGTVVLPTRTTIRLLATAEDVIHSWAIPALGLKLDCVPGRMFVSFINIIREGAYYGQCSELCGWNHYNMPIVLYALPYEHFISWWEIELHGVLIEKLVSTGKHYQLLNIKYK